VRLRKEKKLLVPNFNGLQKHASLWKGTFACSKVVIGQYYINNINQHIKNEQQYGMFHGRAFVTQ
jgi:hypothetical protein